MSKFIKLTDTVGEACIINTEKISYIYKDNDGDSHISFGHQGANNETSYISVKETIEQIMELLK